MFSKLVERLIFLLIVVFAGIVIASVVLQDNLGSAEPYVLSVELGILAVFLLELVLKLCAVGLVFLKDWWNIVDWVVVIASIGLVIVELDDPDKLGYSELSATLRLFRLVIAYRKSNEFKRIHHKYKRSTFVGDYNVEMAYERVQELLHSLLIEPFIAPNKPLVDEINWCIDVLASNKLFDPVVNVQKDAGGNKDDNDLVKLVKFFSAHPGNSTLQSKRRSSSLQRSETLNLRSGLSEEVLECLAEVDSGEFDVFHLKELTNGQELVTLLHILFGRTDLCLTTNLAATQLKGFATGVQNAYHPENPYHNATHAADVLQSIHFFLGTCGLEDFLSTSPLELAGAYLGAAIHDMDHPGVTNAYLINTQAKLAMRYNDRSVLENHHVASAFALTLEEDKDLFAQLLPEDYRHIRMVMIEMVLATDIAQHFSLLMKFKGKFLTSRSDLAADDRIMALSFLLHAADISNPSKPWNLCRRWAGLVLKEFWIQGDQERVRGLEISYMMDRFTVNVAKSQVGFIDVIVKPIFFALREITQKFEDSCVLLTANREKWAERVGDVGLMDDRTVTEMSKDHL
jgi:hypothetical protein